MELTMNILQQGCQRTLRIEFARTDLSDSCDL